ncbi:hypothetical protein KP509_13G045000 [Ceratopteris richardii]|nr:hypothetical protein KP509_13G045000 [Ceratopteris richardii]
MQEPQEDSNRKASEVTDRVEQLQSDEVHEVGAEKEGSSEETKKFVEVLKETAEELKEQAEKAREAFAVTAEETAAILTARAQETAEKSKEGLSYIAENAPDPIREIADTALKAHPTETHKNFSKIHDFCLGIPYGSILVIGGLLSFMISGSTVAIRFGVILGGILLGFSVSSLRAWKEGKPTYAYIQGQAVISAILALRQMRRLLEVKTFFPTFIFTMISGAMLAFYSRMLLAGEDPPRKTQEPAP